MFGPGVSTRPKAISAKASRWGVVGMARLRCGRRSAQARGYGMVSALPEGAPSRGASDANAAIVPRWRWSFKCRCRRGSEHRATASATTRAIDDEDETDAPLDRAVVLRACRTGCACRAGTAAAIGRHDGNPAGAQRRTPALARGGERRGPRPGPVEGQQGRSRAVGAGHAVAAAGAYPVGVARGGAGARAIEAGAAGAEDQAEGGRGFLRQALPAAFGLRRAQEPGWQDAGPGDGCADLRALAGAEAEVSRRRQRHRTLAPAV